MPKHIVQSVYILTEDRIDKTEKNKATMIDNNVINGAIAPKNKGYMVYVNTCISTKNKAILYTLWRLYLSHPNTTPDNIAPQKTNENPHNININPT